MAPSSSTLTVRQNLGRSAFRGATCELRFRPRCPPSNQRLANDSRCTSLTSAPQTLALAKECKKGPKITMRTHHRPAHAETRTQHSRGAAKKTEAPRLERSAVLSEQRECVQSLPAATGEGKPAQSLADKASRTQKKAALWLCSSDANCQVSAEHPVHALLDATTYSATVLLLATNGQQR